MQTEAAATLYAIDTMPLLYRGYFAFLRNPRVTSNGINTSALYGFAAVLLQIIEQYNPTHIAVVLDSDTLTFRHQEYPPYKAQRQKPPEDISAAIPMAMELAQAMGISALRVNGFEADDLLGTLAAMAKVEGLKTCLVTPDKDVAQLVDDNTMLLRPGKAGAPPELLDAEAVCCVWGLKTPAQMIDFLGLAGDSSDNIPGISGVGEKTAVSLLQQFGSLDELFARSDELKGKLAERVATGKNQALLSRSLATIRRDVPLDVSLASLRLREPDKNVLRAFLAKYELLQLGRRLLGENVAISAGRSFRTINDTPHDYICVQNEATLTAMLATLGATPTIAMDCETTSLDPWEARLVGLSFAVAPGKAWYLPVPSDTDECNALLERIKPVLSNPLQTKIGHNLKYDLTVLRQHGVKVAGTLRDSMLAHYVYDASDRHGLDHLSRIFLEYDPIPIASLIGPKGAGQKNMGDLAPEEIAPYAAEDADIALQLYEKLQPLVKANGGQRALSECEEPLLSVLLDIEAEGVRVDPDVLYTYSRELEQDLFQLDQQIREFAGGSDLNISSPKQLGELLFDQLKLDPNAKRTPTGQYATDEETLQRLAGRHPIIDLILEYRSCSKLKSTYVDKLPENINTSTGRVHTTFSQALTETGRLSSANPNLQNIPIRTPRGRLIRKAFIARDENHVLISADYSQIELRMMAALSGDEALKAAFERGADIHTETASRVYNVLPGMVTPEMRSHCKMVNFGIIYGISAFGLSQRLRIPRKEAAELIENYFIQYPGVKNYMERIVEQAREQGYVSTLLGRRRFLRDIKSRNGTARQAAERNAINTPVQGSAADLIKLAMVRIHHDLQADNMRTRMVLQIHDELLFDAPRAEETVVRGMIETAMCNVLDIGVPLVVEIGSGPNWLDAH